MDNVIFAAFLRLIAQKLGMPVNHFASWLFNFLTDFLMEAGSFDLHGLMDTLKMDSYVICDGKEGKAYIGDRCPQYKPESEKPMTISWNPGMTFLRKQLLSAIPFEVDTMVIPSTFEMESYKYISSSSEVKHLIIEEGRKEIDPGAFYWYKIETVTLPEGLERICNDAFAHCDTLKEINIPATVKVIGEDSFTGCGSLPEDIKEQLIAIGGQKVFGRKVNKD